MEEELVQLSVYHFLLSKRILNVQEGRETLARLKRMAGFESQNFDPMVSLPTLPLESRAMADSAQPNAATATTLENQPLTRPLLVQENDVEREFQIHRTEADYSLAEFWRWTLALLIGVAMGVLGFAVDWGIEKLNNFKYDSTVILIRGGGESSLSVLQAELRGVADN